MGNRDSLGGSAASEAIARSGGASSSSPGSPERRQSPVSERIDGILHSRHLHVVRHVGREIRILEGIEAADDAFDAIGCVLFILLGIDPDKHILSISLASKIDDLIVALVSGIKG